MNVKKIEKECITDTETIEMILSDPRDNYVYNAALGEIGSIYLSPQGIVMLPKIDHDRKKNITREKRLLEEFKTLFETEEYNPLSGEYFQKAQKMIEDGALVSFGYTIKTQEELDQYTESSIKRH